MQYNISLPKDLCFTDQLSFLKNLFALYSFEMIQSLHYMEAIYIISTAITVIFFLLTS